ncbi:tetratricopeptide repeat protein [Maribellus maritimus]|uniref:tetratricopeptide repeat protein n=1 Tax=Maribellus maritimus TaxID=2870838 RepID=UPI001EEA0448|nr:tetratricopeptide repeat protein [Maribellus maritimus]MCG6189728.1 tetratricopeptide repeat protein [Maribellus maritimus]
MTEKQLKNKYVEICDNLAARKLKPAFDQLEKLINEKGLLALTDEYRNLEETYHYMLKYTVEGIQDPERQKVYRKLIVSVYELTDKVNEALRLKFSSSVEYEKKRLWAEDFIKDFSGILPELEDFYLDKDLKSLIENGEIKTSNQLADAKQHQKEIVRLFYHFWFSNELSSEETDFLRAFFESEQIIDSYKALIVSALMLSSQRYFCPEKLKVFFELYESDQNEISQRALIALLINFYRYDSRMQYYPEITGRLKILNEDPGFKRNLERIIIQLIRSKETEKIQKKIKDEIIPEMIKISPNLKDKINLDSLMDDSISDDKNPEWEEIFKDSPGLMDKMEEFSELQMEGADVFIGSFSMLKLFPFFNEISNWFIPFFSENPQISQDINLDDDLNRKFIETINSAPILCNSDKYSFCFSIQNLPAENREFMAQGMKAEMDQFKEIEKDKEITAPGKKAEFISNQYIQDLYRFYKLHPRKSGFEDIFSWRFDFHNSETIGGILQEDPKILRNIAEYYFGKNYFDEAVEIYNYLLTIEKGGEIYQKIAFCYQKMGMFQKALDNYQKAELYELNKLWNYKKIALCFRNLKQPASALEYYREAEKIDPENLNIQLSIGHCLLELGEFEEALKCYFKVEYLSPGNKKVWRPIGWCSFVSGKKQQAEKYFQKLVDDEPNKHDLMNMGHVQWSMGNRKEALDYYKKSVEKNDFTEQEFFDVLEEDYHHLVGQGVNPEDVPIMLDQLRYFIEN